MHACAALPSECFLILFVCMMAWLLPWKPYTFVHSLCLEPSIAGEINIERERERERDGESERERERERERVGEQDSEEELVR